MRPFFSLPRDLRFALRCLAAAALVLTLTLTPLTGTAIPEPEPDAIPCALSDDLSLELLARVLAAEAPNRSYAAQIGIAAALLNRVSDPRFPSDLGAVIADAGLRTAADPIPARARHAAEAALMGTDPVMGAVNWGEEAGEIEYGGIWFWG